MVIVKKQSGGKILGIGRDGCVVDPPLMCNSSMSKLNKISKLINVTDVSNSQYQDYVNEYKSGKIFRKYDPNNLHFLPGIDMCNVSESEQGVTKSMKKDIKKCGYKKKGKETYMLNIIMKKGQDFPKITQNLSEKDFLKSLAYILTGAKQCIYEMNILLLDIKGPNLLYSKDDGHDDIYPVFIDFSDDFVIKSKKGFLDFIKAFGRSLPYYDTWPFEILVLFYAEFNAKNDQNTTKNANKINNYFDDIQDFRGIDLDSKNGENMMNAVIEYVNNNTKTRKGLYGVYNKIMMYSIGKTYYRAFMNSKIKNNKDIEKILLGLTDEDIHSRFYADDALAAIGKHISWKNRGQLLITPKSKALKNKVDKKLKIKKLLQQAIKVQNKKKSPPGLNKIEPPLPSGLRMSPMTPLSFRQHVSKKPKKIVKKKLLQQAIKVQNKKKSPGLKKIGPPLPSGLRMSPMTPSFRQHISKKSKKIVKKKQKVVKKVKKVKSKASKSVSRDCMKMKVADIRKTKAYKALPRAVGKSKLKKKELCAILQKKSASKGTKQRYGKLSKENLIDIIQNKKNC